jgi:hypothetical protein
VGFGIARSTYNYSRDVKHEELGKHQVVRGATRSEANLRAEALHAQWDREWKKQCQAEQARAERERVTEEKRAQRQKNTEEKRREKTEQETKRAVRLRELESLEREAKAQTQEAVSTIERLRSILRTTIAQDWSGWRNYDRENYADIESQ